MLSPITSYFVVAAKLLILLTFTLLTFWRAVARILSILRIFSEWAIIYSQCMEGVGRWEVREGRGGEEGVKKSFGHSGASTSHQ